MVEPGSQKSKGFLTCGDVASIRPLITRDASTSLPNLLGAMFLDRLTQIPLTDKSMPSYPPLTSNYIAHQRYGNLTGVVDVVDIAAYFGAFKAEKYSSMTAEDMIGLNFEMRQGERPNGLLVVPETLPLADMVSFLAFGIRHAYVKSENSDDELRVLSQMDLLKYLARDPAAQKISSQAIATSGLIDRRETPLCIVDSACTVKDAFAKIVKEFADAGAIVDSFGYLIGTLSTSDVRELVKGQGIESNLKLTVTEFLAAVHRGEGIAEPVTVVPEDSVATAMNKMLEKDVRRAWVVNEAYEPIGCIAAEDVIAKFGRNYFE